MPPLWQRGSAEAAYIEPMSALSIPHAEALWLFQEQQATSSVATAHALDELALLGHSRCDGWSRLDVLVHVRAGLQEMTGGCAARTDRPAEHVAASYWRTPPDDRDADPVPHLLWLRRTASAYAWPISALHTSTTSWWQFGQRFSELPDALVLFQDKSMASGDFVATWVVASPCTSWTSMQGRGDQRHRGRARRRTAEALAGAALPSDLDDRTAVLAAFGRIRSPDAVNLPRAYPLKL